MDALIKSGDISSPKIIELKRLIKQLSGTEIDYCFGLETQEEVPYTRAYNDRLIYVFFYNEDTGDMIVRINLINRDVEALLDQDHIKKIKIMLNA